MACAELEASIREEALRDAPRRAGLLASRLTVLELDARRPLPPDVGRELRYLERLSATAASSDPLRARLAGLQRRAFIADARALLPPGSVAVSLSPTVLRSGEPLSSPELGALPTGARAEVLEVGAGPTGRRLRVRAQRSGEEAQEGWVSYVAQDGEPLWRPEARAAGAEAPPAPGGEAPREPAGAAREMAAVGGPATGAGSGDGLVGAQAEGSAWPSRREPAGPAGPGGAVAEAALGRDGAGAAGGPAAAASLASLAAFLWPAALAQQHFEVGPVAPGEAGLSAAKAPTAAPARAAARAGSAAAAATGDRAEDEVRLLAVEGQLNRELSRHLILTVPSNDSALVFRAWTETDEAAEGARERFALLELSRAAANLREIAQLAEGRVEASQEPLDEIEALVAGTASDSAEAVAQLQDAGNKHLHRFVWVAPSVALVVVGSAVAVSAPAACVASLALRGAFVAGATATAGLGSWKLADWQRRAIASLREQLPRAFAPLPEVQAAMLRAAGDEAQRRLFAKLGGREAWQRVFSPVGWFRGLQAMARPSDIRAGGLAWATSFCVAGEARRVFERVRNLGAASSLDPGNKVCWSCPVDSETFLRYLIFSDLFNNRDFFCVCRYARAPGAGDADGGERYAFALSSLCRAMVVGTGLPAPDPDAKQASIHVCGVAVTATAGGSRVEVMADVDPNVAGPAALLADGEIRRHVLRTASVLCDRLKGC